MNISSIASSSYQPAIASGSLDRRNQAFQELGIALNSGSLSDAKEAMSKLEKLAPPNAGTANDPIGKSMKTLSTALDSGDMENAKQAYADIKEATSQNLQTRGGLGGPPQGGPPAKGAKPSSGTADTSSLYESYEPEDVNEDGTVSAMERLTYSFKHPDETAQTSATTQTDRTDSVFDILT